MYCTRALATRRQCAGSASQCITGRPRSAGTRRRRSGGTRPRRWGPSCGTRWWTLRSRQSLPAAGQRTDTLARACGSSCVAGTSSIGTPPPPCTGHAQICTGPCTCPGNATRVRSGRPASARPQGRTKRHIGHGVDDDAGVCGRGLRDAPQAALQHVVAVQVLHLRRRLHPHLRACARARGAFARGWEARYAPGRRRASRRSGGAGRPPSAGEKGCQHAYARD